MLPYRSLLIRLFLPQLCVIQRRHRRLGSGAGVGGIGDGRCGFLEVQQRTESEPCQDMADFSMVCGVKPGEYLPLPSRRYPSLVQSSTSRMSMDITRFSLATAHLAARQHRAKDTHSIAAAYEMGARTLAGRTRFLSMQVSILIRWPSYGNL
ncbi:hypothetical protein CPAR01_13468 [Colletotrichum paranaense]|uniref:Secreted protein n=1 Tax=Colletotrichum paranaense TaxID=1914294 RepID=A0ABQ9S4H5_9PEZI|nr:uncharacterized protein CPAR01_13468 [Colletotrichum paranaense]KAK1524520.1 hypothetical protein CPAR01_13468 [Colletotrichum paranaense]